MFKFKFSILEMRRIRDVRKMWNRPYWKFRESFVETLVKLRMQVDVIKVAGSSCLTVATVASLGISLRKHRKKTPWVTCKCLLKTFGLPILHLTVNCVGNLPSGAIKSSLKAACADAIAAVFWRPSHWQTRRNQSDKIKVRFDYFFSFCPFFLYANSECVCFQMQSS